MNYLIPLIPAFAFCVVFAIGALLSGEWRQ